MTTVNKGFWGYQQDYMRDRLGDDYATSGSAITTDGFAEQTAFISFVYAGIRWASDKLFH